jgi:hypothetical protein
MESLISTFESTIYAAGFTLKYMVTIIEIYNVKPVKEFRG